MRCSELMLNLEYWQKISGEKDPEVVVNSGSDTVFEILDVKQSFGDKEENAIGICI